MKKIVSLFLVLLLILTLPACGRRNQKPTEPEPSAVPESVVPSDEQSSQSSDEVPPPSDVPLPEPAVPADTPEEIPAQNPNGSQEDTPSDEGSDEPSASIPIPDEDGWYYDVENVTAYLMAYGKLPSNYITKKEAEDLGWSGGSIQKFKEGAAIGGGRFGNYEGLLPEGKYTECDIDTDGARSRGAKRLVFSSDGRYFYTDDHYETFAEVMFVDGRMVLDYDY